MNDWCLYIYIVGHINSIPQLWGDGPIRVKNDWSRDLDQQSWTEQ